jgi:hypothetical protein
MNPGSLHCCTLTSFNSNDCIEHPPGDPLEMHPASQLKHGRLFYRTGNSCHTPRHCDQHDDLILPDIGTFRDVFPDG